MPWQWAMPRDSCSSTRMCSIAASGTGISSRRCSPSRRRSMTELPPGWLRELSEFLAIPSVSAEPEHADDVGRAAEWVAGKVRRLGGEADIREEGRLLVGESPGPPGAPTVLVY